MPGISDPGYELVKACVEGIPVVPIPGPVAAISAAGLPTRHLYLKDFTGERWR